MMHDDHQREDTEYFRRASEGLSQSLAEITSLNETARKLLSARDQQEIAAILMTSVREILKTGSAELYFYDDEAARFVPDASVESPALLPPRDVLDWLIREGKPSTVPTQEGKSVTLHPLMVKEQCCGLLCIDVTADADALTPQRINLLATLADHAAVALMNARLFTQSNKQVNLLNNILDSITNGIMTIDMENNITNINRNAMAMLELNPDAVLRLPYRDVFPEILTATVDAMLAETREMGFAMERQVNHTLSQGQEIPMAVSTSLLRDETLSTIGVIVVLRDMTASRELDRLRKLDQLKSEFVANVSHELKTPLTSIKAYTEALMDMTTDEQQQSFLKVVDEEADRLLFLISDLLNVSKIQSGKLKLNMTLVNPRIIVEEILHISKIKSEKHTLTVNYSPYLEEMLMDKERMKEVMINLISNAIKYSPEGGAVTVSLDVFEKNLKIEVKDQGIGISKEHLGKIFDQFYRVDSSITASIGGTGLGLAIVKSIIETHGGIIKCDSEPGKGSLFTVLLPIRKEMRPGAGLPVTDSFVD